MNFFAKIWDVIESDIVADSDIAKESVSMIIDMHRGKIYKTIMDKFEKEKLLRPYVKEYGKKNRLEVLMLSSQQGNMNSDSEVIECMKEISEGLYNVIADTKKNTSHVLLIDKYLQLADSIEKTYLGARIDQIYNINIFDIYKNYASFCGSNGFSNEKIDYDDYYIEFLTGLSADHIYMLHNNDTIETIVYLVKEYLYKRLVAYIKNNIKKTQLKVIYDLSREEIVEEEYYHNIKKSRHYISSPTTCYKLIEEFLSSQEGGLMSIIDDSIIKRSQSMKKLTKENIIASISFVESDLQDEIFKILYDYILEKWKQNILNEYKLLSIKDAQIFDINNIDGIQENQSTIISPIKIGGDSFVLSERDEKFIQDLSERLKYSELQSIELESYCIKMIKNNKDIKLIQRLNQKGVTITQDDIYDIHMIFNNYEYKESSMVFENIDQKNKIDGFKKLKENKGGDTPINDAMFVEGDCNFSSFQDILLQQNITIHSEKIIESQYNKLQSIDKKLLQEKLKLCISHPDTYWGRRPNKYKVLKFGLNLGRRLLMKDGVIQSIQSKSDDYDRSIDVLYNVK